MRRWRANRIPPGSRKHVYRRLLGTCLLAIAVATVAMLAFQGCDPEWAIIMGNSSLRSDTGSYIDSILVPVKQTTETIGIDIAYSPRRITSDSSKVNCHFYLYLTALTQGWFRKPLTVHRDSIQIEVAGVTARAKWGKGDKNLKRQGDLSWTCFEATLPRSNFSEGNPWDTTGVDVKINLSRAFEYDGEKLRYGTLRGKILPNRGVRRSWPQGDYPGKFGF